MLNKLTDENTKKARKSKGRVYTPDYIVKTILDMAHYNGNNILQKHVIDNSCGDGAFLCEIVNRYCEVAIKNNISIKELKIHLETYIHGIEIDFFEHKKCLENLNFLIKKYGIEKALDWDIVCKDALTVDKYNGKMDFVLGNPPYVRVHNLNNSLQTAKKFSFAQDGMTDLYIVFYEIGIQMLNENGILGYITPSSFFNSIAGTCMRKYLVQKNLIEIITDLKHYQAFNTTTYTTIVVLNKNKTDNNLKYFQFDEKTKSPYYVETLTYDDCYIAGNFYFGAKENLNLLKKIFLNTKHCNVQVKNGYATLCDNVYIGNFDFKSKYIIPVIKASRGETKQIIYPYDKNGKPISEKELSENKELYKYLLGNKEKLLKRSLENKTRSCWFAFGRSQAVNDTYKDKLVINALLRTHKDLKILFAPSGTGVYSGFYITGDFKTLSDLPDILLSEEFSTYISLLGKYKSGGYYTFSSKDIKAYLDYKLSYNGGDLKQWTITNS